MRIHWLNSVSTCPLGGALMDGRSWGRIRGELTCTCLLVETASELVLVDSGLGLHDVAAPRTRLSGFFLSMLDPDFREEMTAIRQIERLGYDPRDVRHIVLTHLDFDHAGGLDDFPEATIHMMLSERDSAVAQKSWLDRQRFRPQQWSTRDRWQVYPRGRGESWYGLDAVRGLEGLPPEILLVPLTGHTLGHAGVAIRDGERWLLNAGDAYFFHAEMEPTPSCTPGLRAYQMMMEKDRRLRLSNQDRLRELRQAHGAQLEIFCSHDPHEFEHHAGRPPSLPASPIV